MKELSFKVAGLTCGACAKLAANRFKKVPGVQEASVADSGEAKVSSIADLDLEILQESLKGTPYSIVK